jgi:Ca2+/H+ antiporter
MKLKPITPAMHGLVDYAFAAALLTVPSLIGCNRKTVGLYSGVAIEVFLYGAMTKQPAALWPLIPMKAHKLIDVANLSGLSLLTGYKGIRRKSNAVVFNIGMVALGLATVLLTQWRKRDRW